MAEGNGGASGRWTPLVHLALIAGLSVAVYANTMQVPFHWDGVTLVEKNLLLKDFSFFAAPLDHMDHPAAHRLFRRYLAYLSFAVNFNLLGGELAGFHAVNTAMHACNAVMVYLLVVLLFRTPRLRRSPLFAHRRLAALLAAALFAVHPLQTMAVTYIYQRLALQVTLFYLAAVLAYLGGRTSDTRGARWTLLALAAVLIVPAVLTKENAVTLPFVFLLIELLLFTGPIVRRLLFAVPVAVVGAATTVALFAVQPKPTTEFINTVAAMALDHGPLEYLVTQPKVLVAYLGLFVLPMGQSMVHEMAPARSLLEPEVAVSVVLLLALFGVALWTLRRASSGEPALRIVSLGILWFFVTHAVESSFIPLHVLMQEYRMYLPMVGLVVLPGVGLAALWHRFSASPLRWAAVATAVCVVLGLGVATHRRNRIWQSSASLWADVLAKYPRSPRGLYNLAQANEQSGDLEGAIKLYNAALEVDPRIIRAHFSLARIHERRGDPEQAVNSLRAARGVLERWAPQISRRKLATHYRNLGGALAELGALREAIPLLEQAVAAKPEWTSSRYILGIAYGRLGEPERARAHMESVYEEDPDYKEVAYYLGYLLAQLGEVERGLALLEAFGRRPELSPGNMHLLVRAYMQLERYDLALAFADRLVKSLPGDPRAAEVLAEVQARVEQGGAPLPPRP